MLCFSNFKDKVERSMPAGTSAKIAAFDAADSIWTTGDKHRLNVNIQSQDGAYVIYTYVDPSVKLKAGVETKTKFLDLAQPGSQRAWTAAT